MHKIDHPTAAPGGLFTIGDPIGGVQATVVTADWLNAVQGEIVNVVEGAGLPLDKPDNAQLLAAIAALIEAAGQSWRTGDVKLTMQQTVEAGWILCDDGTIGNATSAGTSRANDDCEALFLLLWNNVSDTYAPVSGGRGASASLDWDAGKTIGITKMLGRALAVAGSGVGLTSRSMGQTVGAETHALTEGEMPSHGHVGTAASNGAHTHTGTASSAGNHSHTVPREGNIGTEPYSNTGPLWGDMDTVSTVASSTTGAHTHSLSLSTQPAHSHAITIDDAGGDGAHNNMQPTAFLHAHIKL